MKRQIALADFRSVRRLSAPANGTESPEGTDRLRELDAEFDALVEQMRGPAFRQGVDALFDAGPTNCRR